MKNKMKRIVSLVTALVLLALSFSFAGCSEKSEYVDFDYFEMDTYIKIRLARSAGALGQLDEAYLKSVADECDAILRRLDTVLSCHNPASQLSSLNTEVGTMIGVNDDLITTLGTAEKLSSLTDGAFDYTLGSLTELWNITGGGPVPTIEDITDALSHTGTDKFTVKDSTIVKSDKMAKIDLGGIGKGMATQILLEYLDTTNVEYAIVSVGGNIGVYGTKPEYGTYKIGVRDPDKQTDVIGYMFISSGFVAVSGDYERYFEADGVRYHHILDPKTGYPARSGVRSVAVHTSNGASADALSTALFVLGVDKSLELYENSTLNFEAIFVTESGEIVTTPGITSDNFLLTPDSYTLKK